jgi:LuxR family maltose regulon positive regulatory protein
MESVLLTTKLFIPRVAPGLVLRPRLLQRFKDILNNVLTIISAPAGFGKTTLLSQWIHTNKPLIPTAWLSLDESENDPMRFWDYIIATLRTIQSGIGANSLTLLHSPQPLPIESVLIPLINDIAAISGETVLVLDDYHFIQSTPVHQGLIFFIEHMPPGIHLVISTRMDPLLPLPHFRGKGKMLEIGADDLRFTLEEAAELLKSVPGPALPPEEVRAINTRTEGWAVGLKMVVLSLSRHTDVKTAIAALTGSQRYIMDYLTDEVLRQLPEKMREFLLRTSILERLSAPLCDVVTGMSASQDILTELERANLFIVPLDELQQWYRYHHLFAELLRHHFEIEYPPETVAELQKKASEWHEVHGFKEEAVNYALAAQDWQKALDLVNTISSLFTYGGRTTGCGRYPRRNYSITFSPVLCSQQH